MSTALKWLRDVLLRIVLLVYIGLLACGLFFNGQRYEHWAAFEEGVNEARMSRYLGYDSPTPPPPDVVEAVGDRGPGIWRKTDTGWLFQPMLKWYTVNGLLEVREHSPLDEERSW